ncbi:hypothetical protein SAMN04488103_10778 [Gemmobacter aquatilis]|uniref:Uncharacterized protein n=1 Tax=Gemmobacter aquatilis TaxID=933059 RepID=A0A1H8IY75_9RHOB|nr:hypothetical protein [Gemmobacter aquatilis]SEN73401.1 hypothetical protein SAMN04488103_10778 [Gemmobacter aquatilis]
MRQDWIFDVLSDLRSFALTNGLPALAAQVETAMRVAEVELAARATMTGGRPRPN